MIPLSEISEGLDVDYSIVRRWLISRPALKYETETVDGVIRICFTEEQFAIAAGAARAWFTDNEHNERTIDSAERLVDPKAAYQAR